MKRLFAGSLSIFLFIGCSGLGLGVQKKKRARTRRTRPPVELPARNPITVAQRKPSPIEIKPANNEEAKVISFIESFDSLAEEIVEKVNTAKDKAKGVDEAQKLMEAQKDKLKQDFASIRCIPESGIRGKIKVLLSEHLFYDGFIIGQLQATYGADPIVQTKLQKLTSDLLNIVKMEGACPKQSLAAY